MSNEFSHTCRAYPRSPNYRKRLAREMRAQFHRHRRIRIACTGCGTLNRGRRRRCRKCRRPLAHHLLTTLSLDDDQRDSRMFHAVQIAILFRVPLYMVFGPYEAMMLLGGDEIIGPSPILTLDLK
ncbi:MAG: hypothetical protein GY715_05770 [Planctomycetes bacterium]|nr:hypothetical protein [Planctomycetota bacterium]